MNSNAQLAILAAGGTALYFATRSGDSSTEAPASAAPPKTGVKNFKSLRGVKGAVLGGAGVTQQIMQKLGQISNPSKSGGSASGYPKEIEDRMKAELKAQWEAASAAAKIEICKKIKAQFPKDAGIQAMNCEQAPNMTFQTVFTTVAAAAGFAVCGPPCSVVGVLVAAYAGPKLEEFAKRAWGDVKDFGKDIGEKIGDAFPWNW